MLLCRWGLTWYRPHCAAWGALPTADRIPRGFNGSACQGLNVIRDDVEEGQAEAPTAACAAIGASPGRTVAGRRPPEGDPGTRVPGPPTASRRSTGSGSFGAASSIASGPANVLPALPPGLRSPSVRVVTRRPGRALPGEPATALRREATSPPPYSNRSGSGVTRFRRPQVLQYVHFSRGCQIVNTPRGQVCWLGIKMEIWMERTGGRHMGAIAPPAIVVGQEDQAQRTGQGEEAATEPKDWADADGIDGRPSHGQGEEPRGTSGHVEQGKDPAAHPVQQPGLNGGAEDDYPPGGAEPVAEEKEQRHRERREDVDEHVARRLKSLGADHHVPIPAAPRQARRTGTPGLPAPLSRGATSRICQCPRARWWPLRSRSLDAPSCSTSQQRARVLLRQPLGVESTSVRGELRL